MVPYSKFMFDRTVILQKAMHTTGGMGSSQPSYPGAPMEIEASVQRTAVDRVDAQGRTYTQTVHNVLTRDEPGAMAGVAAVTTGDRFMWRDHVLIADGHAEPSGIERDVVWRTPCLEVR